MSLISDAGTPLLSDPGRLLVNHCIKKGIVVTPIPGASSVTSSISVSGFKDQFLFYGFLPKTINELEKVLSKLSEIEYSLVFFVPSIKINFYITSFKKFFSDRKILIAREITKIHEAFLRSDINKLKTFRDPVKGELTIVISERTTKEKKFDEKKIVNKIKKYLKNYSVKDTVNLILETEKINKKKIYDLCLKVKDNE